MDRGARLFSFLEKASDLLYSPTSRPDAREKLCNLVEKNLEFFRSFPEYVQHVASLQLANNFAHLPNEVINDVVTIAAEDQHEQPGIRIDLCYLVNIEGSWGQLAQRQIPILLEKSKPCSKHFRLGKVQSHDLTPNELGKRPIAKVEITEDTDFNLLQAVAPNLCDSVEFVDVGNAPGNVLELITGNFRKMAWRCTESRRANNRLQRGAIDFIKRQLQSKHLMELHITAEGFEMGELDELLVKFVKRPFTMLNIAKSSSPGPTEFEKWKFHCGGYCLPFQAVDEFCRTWESTKQFSVGVQQVCATVSDETLEKMKNRFPLDLEKLGEQKLKKEHPHVSATMEITLWNFYADPNSKTVSLFFCK